jgi:hypothetical protein
MYTLIKLRAVSRSLATQYANLWLSFQLMTGVGSWLGIYSAGSGFKVFGDTTRLRAHPTHQKPLLIVELQSNSDLKI